MCALARAHVLWPMVMSVLTAPMLAMVIPVLLRGLREREAATKRLCGVIINNLIKLTMSEDEVKDFIETLIEPVQKALDLAKDSPYRSRTSAGAASKQRWICGAAASSMGVAKVPGLTDTTSTPHGRASHRRASVNTSAACLDAA